MTIFPASQIDKFDEAALLKFVKCLEYGLSITLDGGVVSQLSLEAIIAMAREGSVATVYLHQKLLEYLVLSENYTADVVESGVASRALLALSRAVQVVVRQQHMQMVLSQCQVARENHKIIMDATSEFILESAKILGSR